MNILFVGAHHDDLEVSIGGSVSRWVSEGHRVFSAILTDSIWTGPDGKKHRRPEQVEEYTRRAAELLGYTPLNLNLAPCLNLHVCDDHVVRVLQVLSQHAIDMLITISPNDAHPDHRAAAEIALNASRKIPRVLSTRVSWNSYPGGFVPNFFVDVTGHLEKKSKAMMCFKDEYARTGKLWETYSRATAELYGLEAGCEHAEGYVILKYRY